MSGAFYHAINPKRSVKIGVFNVCCWIAGFALGVFGYWTLTSLWALLLIPAAVLIGFPVRDAGSPHAWLLKHWRAYRNYKKSNGVKIAPPLIGGNDAKQKSRLQQVIAAEAHVPERNHTATILNLLTTEAKTHLTVGLCLEGASKDWVNADGSGKFRWDLAWMQRVAEAVSTTSEPDLKFVMTHIHRPANREIGLSHNRSRVRQAAIEAAAKHDGQPLDIQTADADTIVGTTTVANFDLAYDTGGEDYDYAFLRMEWPRRHGRKIDLRNAEHFKASSLYKIISRLLTAYDQMGVQARFASAENLCEAWDNVFVGDLGTRRMYRHRDAALERKPELDQPLSLTTGKPGLNTWLEYDGAYHVAGFVSKFNQEEVEPGFLPHTFQLENELSYALSTVISARPMKSEKRKAREHERWLKMVSGWNPLNKNLSNPDEDSQLFDVLSKRQRLSASKWRASDSYHIISVDGTEPDESHAHWDDLATQAQGLLDVKKLTNGDDIEEALLIQLGVLF